MKIFKVFFLSAILLVALLSCSNQPEVGTVILDTPAMPGSELPFMVTDNTGKLFLSWVEAQPETGAYVLKYSGWADGNWSEPEQVLSSDTWFVNWADYPSVIAFGGEAVAAHVLNKIPGNTYSYNVNISLKRDNAWTEPLSPHSDSTATEHGFVSMIPLGENKIMAAWLDGRRTENRTEAEYFDLNKAMTLRSAVIDSSGDISNKRLLDESVCDCCQTSMVNTEEGPFIAYRNRTDDEIRDIYYSRYLNDEWSEPKPVYRDNWKIGACPVNGPRVASRDSLVAVSWYTRAGDVPTVKVAVSTNHGESFKEPLTVSKSNTSGRVDVAIGKSGIIYLSDLLKSEGSYHLTLHEVDYAEGTVNSRSITEMNGSRRSGFPQMELTDHRLFFAWTDVTEDTLSQIQTASLTLE